LSFEFFISKRLIRKNVQGKKVSKPILSISIISISLAIVVNLITVAIVTGFQNQIRQKITGFNAPLFISKAGSTGFYESEPIHKNQSEILELMRVEGVKSISPVCYKPALLQSKKFEDTLQLISGKDSIIKKQEIAGVVMKGVDSQYDWNFVRSHLLIGRIPRINESHLCKEIVVSSKIATNLNYKIGEEIMAFYMKNEPLTVRYKIVGIYATGLEEFDKKIVYCDIREVQRISDFGISSFISLDDTLTASGSILLKANVSGNVKDLLFDWGKGPDVYGGVLLNKISDTLIKLVVHQMDYLRNKSIPLDTSFIRFKTEKNPIDTKKLKQEPNGFITREIVSEDSFNLFSANQKINVRLLNGKGTYADYVTGYEVQLNDWSDLSIVEVKLKESIEMKPTKNNELLQVKSVLSAQSDLFSWLSFLDYNVLIIIILMLVIGIINVGSAMLVLIVVKTNMIGILKSLGSTNWAIRKIFLLQAAYLIVRGMLFGNLIGVIVCLVQMKFGIIKLDPSVYYIDKVPVELTLFNWLSINLITFFVCMISLLVPSYVITRISPTKAIRFN
jgi:lipoprotein-releasing system permease protein